MTYILTLGIYLTVFAYGRAGEKVRSDNNENQMFNSKSIDSLYDKHIDQVSFGIFCGECSHNCATMYRYSMVGNQNSLFVDHTDSYFNNYGKISFGTQITDKNKLAIADKIVKNIPDNLLTTKKSIETFGCPDCTDGCGIYFEIHQGKTTKKFYIDYSNSEMPKEIQKFAEFLKTNIRKL